MNMLRAIPADDREFRALVILEPQSTERMRGMIIVQQGDRCGYLGANWYPPTKAEQARYARANGCSVIIRVREK